MKRLLLAVALLTAFPCATMAQVEKQVEVTKAYVPKVEQAAKLAIEPDMTDTVQMRPEIDYTITPPRNPSGRRRLPTGSSTVRCPSI